MKRIWAENDYFYWADRGVGKIISLKEDSYEVLFPNEPQATVSKPLFEERAQEVTSEGFFAIEGFFPDQLKTAIDEASAKIIDWIVQDQKFLGQPSIANHLIEKLLKKHFKSRSDWLTWRKKFGSILRKHPELGKKEGKGRNISYPIIEKEKVKLFKEPNVEADFDDNVRIFTEIRHLVLEDQKLKGAWKLYFKTFLDDENIYRSVKSSFIQESLTERFDYEKLANQWATRLKILENWSSIRRLAIEEQIKLLDEVTKYCRDEINDILAYGCISTSLHKASRNNVVKKLIALNKDKWVEIIGNSIDSVPSDSIQKYISPVMELLGLIDQEFRDKLQEDKILSIVGILIRRRFYELDEWGKIIKFFTEKTYLIEREEVGTLGKLILFQDLVNVSKNIEEAKKFFDDIVVRDNKEVEDSLRNSAKTYLYANFVNVNKELSVPIREEICCSYLNIYPFGEVDSMKRKVLENIFLDMQLKQIKFDRIEFTHSEVEKELGVQIAQEANKILDFSASKSEKIRQKVDALMKILSHPRGYMAVGYIMSQLFRMIENKESEFNSYKEKINSPEFIRGLAEKEIERSLAIRKENLEKSLISEKEKFEFNLFSKVAELIVYLIATLEDSINKTKSYSPQDYSSTVQNFKGDLQKKLANLSLILIGEIGEEVSFNPNYHEVAGGVGVGRFEVVLAGCIWRNPYNDKEIVLRKAILKPK
jgi:hypothetical protein